MILKARTDLDVHGFAVLNKPTGITSHSFLALASKNLGSKIKSGHAGTLDSFASGVLVCMFGTYTRLSDYLMATTKGYEAEILFGEETDSLDPLGQIVATAELPAIDRLDSVLAQFRGNILQVPPAFSAVHINGKRAYELALRGEKPELKPREVSIFSLELLSFNKKTAKIFVSCSKGTYIRSLARDIAIAAGSRGRLSELKRVYSGPFKIEDAIDLENFDSHKLQLIEQSLATELGFYSIILDKTEAKAFCNGIPLYRISGFSSVSDIKEARYTVFDDKSMFLGIVEYKNKSWQYSVVLGRQF